MAQPLPITEAFIRAYNFGRHIELLQIKNEEKIAFQAHLFCLKENVALIPPNFLTLVGDGQKKYESGEDRIVLSRETGTWKIKGHGRGRIQEAAIQRWLQDKRVCWDMTLPGCFEGEPVTALMRSHCNLAKNESRVPEAILGRTEEGWM